MAFQTFHEIWSSLQLVAPINYLALQGIWRALYQRKARPNQRGNAWGDSAEVPGKTLYQTMDDRMICFLIRYCEIENPSNRPSVPRLLISGFLGGLENTFPANAPAATLDSRLHWCNILKMLKVVNTSQHLNSLPEVPSSHPRKTFFLQLL